MNKNLHLMLSVIIVIIAGIVYGGYPSYFIPLIFGFEVEALELQNILRAVMGIYLGIGAFWLLGALKSAYWKSATISNALFMGGISFGRIVSTLFDGVSVLFAPVIIFLHSSPTF